MKQLLLICALVVGQSVLAADKKPLTKDESVKVIEAAIRKAAKKPTGELTKADLEKVTQLDLRSNQLTDVRGLEKLTQLKRLDLWDNQLTDVKSLGKLTQLEDLSLENNQLTSVKDLEKLTQLKELWLSDNQLTKAQIDQLRKTLPKCEIYSNPKK
jgi:Leucine-rich repeat (LRR) protein